MCCPIDIIVKHSKLDELSTLLEHGELWRFHGKVSKCRGGLILGCGQSCKVARRGVYKQQKGWQTFKGKGEFWRTFLSTSI